MLNRYGEFQFVGRRQSALGPECPCTFLLMVAFLRADPEQFPQPVLQAVKLGQGDHRVAATGLLTLWRWETVQCLVPWEFESAEPKLPR